MSNYSVIRDIESTLVNLLWTNFKSDPQIYSDIIGSEKEITLKSPADMSTEDEKLSIFLFRISENAFLKNKKMQKVSAKLLAFPPYPIDLWYLITPITGDITKNHILIGKIMQIFHDNAILKGKDLMDDLSGSTEELRLVEAQLSIEDMTQIWNLFRERDYMLSLCYLVTPVIIESTKEIAARRVIERA